MKDYYELNGFENIYLEDSYVLDIIDNFEEEVVIFLLDLVLLETHDLYKQPENDEKYFYKKGKIVFECILSLLWHEKTFEKTKALKLKNIDFGNVDIFVYENDKYNLSGDWGNLTIKTNHPPYIEWV